MRWYTPFFYTLPFFCFLFGYLVPSFFVSNDFDMPSLIGLSLQEGLVVLGRAGLNARIVDTKEDLSFEPGVIIYQMPLPKSLIKNRQTALLTVSAYPEKSEIPLCVGEFISVGEAKLLERGFSVRVQKIWAANLRDEICFAQWPAAGNQISARRSDVILYCACSGQRLVLMPRLIGRRFEEVLHFLHEHELQPRVSKQSSEYSSALPTGHVVAEQRPLPGAIIDLKRAPCIQLLIEKAV